ncbi:carbohydrate-binding module family 1 protein [Tulasnella calospora MUT 4182]|uniref:Glucanase n=1 Tax=Tulasnella calospora MUT 4182 TaxID=1051891 RepID=A0A0C3QFF9_9AGAM|nr:carbohydrate-binding module family 1 protein [Tulasnella calospora MUT 4182]
MRFFLSATIVSIITTATAQKVGTLLAETPPSLQWYKCVAGGACTSQAGKVVLDAEWRWLHYYQPGYDNCYGPGGWNPTYCPFANPPPCAQNCALDGADYSATYGITTSGNAITLKYVTPSEEINVNSRVFMLSATDNTKYEIWKLLNKELSFDIDVSNLPCGVKGSLYFVEMDADGGKAKYPPNLAGAKYGTGYCDSKCNRNLWINGEANTLGYVGPTDPAYVPWYGSCCGEVDLFEGNEYASAFSAHPCGSITSQTRCHAGSDCSSPDFVPGLCDADGCDWNSYRLGATSFYGLSKTVDTSKKFTVVTQFITSDGTDNGQLVEIKRFYVQNGVVISNNNPTVGGLPANAASIKDNFCLAERNAFGEPDYFTPNGGLTSVGNSLKRGGVLVFGISDDKDRSLQWLDGVWPQDQIPTNPGVKRGSCDAASGNINETRASVPNASVTFSNVRIGVIGSTTSPSTLGTTTTTTTTTTKTVTATTTTTTSGALQTQWGTCGGPTWTGPTVCQAPYTCKCE